ncbi:MAG: CPXCG motif-containing cysteine-rich protein [Gemmatimonadales bacterium]
MIGPADDDDLDDEFPLGDGAADTEAVVRCPYCRERMKIALDPGGGESQEYVQDCEVCCRPWQVEVEYQVDGSAEVSLSPLDEE